MTHKKKTQNGPLNPKPHYYSILGVGGELVTTHSGHHVQACCASKWPCSLLGSTYGRHIFYETTKTFKILCCSMITLFFSGTFKTFDNI